MFTETMLRLFAIVSERNGEQVTRALLELGVMQFITISTLEGEAATGYRDASSLSADRAVQLGELRKRLESFLGSSGIVPRIPPAVTAETAHFDIGEERRRIDTLASGLQGIRERQRIIQNDILKYSEIRRQIDLYGSSMTSGILHTDSSFISLLIGTLPLRQAAAVEEELSRIPAVSLPIGDDGTRRHMIVISMKRDRSRAEAVVSAANWIPVEPAAEVRGAPGDAIESVNTRLAALRDEQDKLQVQSKALITDRRDELVDSWVRLRLNELYQNVQSTFRRSSHTLLFTGWIPASKRHETEQAVAAATGGTYYLEWLSPEHVSDLREEKYAAPVKLHNPRIFAPFQMLVTNFGIPEYGSIDPTPFVVITYLTMFGLMFADLGQGAVVLLLGIIGRLRLKKDSPYAKVSSLLIWCGAASIVVGALFGSLFGYAATRPLWFDFHGIISGHAHPSAGIRSIYDILGITVKFGITVICAGLLFNWINLIRLRRWTELILDKGGLLGGWIYGGGVYCGWFMVMHGYRQLPGSATLLLLLGIPALLLIAHGPVHHAKKRHAVTAGNIATWVMEWAVELLEIFSGYLANTLSFMRVAGLGIAHVSLMTAFFTMADMVRCGVHGFSGTLAATLLIIAGNVMVIALEGLSAGIQALRLNYYEFFTKFFHGMGKLFTPVALRDNNH